MKNPELLAPAGNLECAVAAFEAGADAVYAGLGKFNAREGADNFSIDDMSRVSEKAKRMGRKFYITLNTLVKEEELEAFAKLAAAAAALDPDGFIVQDVGVIRLLRTCFPFIPLHASTQMGIHNSLGLKQARKMGITRVILERQVSLKEISLMREESDMELEVFVHGALCCSLSGTCLFSSWIGGWSGNRGRCKQPCRRRYHSVEKKSSGSGFFFSTNDLFTLDLLPALRNAGVASLKIEGRLKPVEYVRNAVSAYRRVLDASPENFESALRSGKAVLSGTYGRKWSHGFYFEDEKRDIIQFDSIGVSGQLLGKVTDTGKKGFSIVASRKIHSGDRLRIQPRSGDEGPSIVVHRFSSLPLSQEDSRGRKEKSYAFFIFTAQPVPPEGLVYRIGRIEQADGPARKSTEQVAALPLYQPKVPVSLKIRIDKTGIIVKVLSDPEDLLWRQALDIQEARSKPITDDSVRDIFKAADSDFYKAGSIDVELAGDYFIPLSVLKKTRRAFWQWFKEQAGSFPGDPVSLDWKKLVTQPADTETRPAGRSKDTWVKPLHGKTEIPKDSIRAVLLGSKASIKDEVILPPYCFEEDIPRIVRMTGEALKRGIKRFRITSLYQLELFEGAADLSLSTSFPLPAANSLAVGELEFMGAGKVQGWIELGKSSLARLAEKSILPLETYRFGRPWILATRADIPVTGRISDSRGGYFRVEKDRQTGLVFLFPDEVMKTTPVSGTSGFFDMSRASLHEKNTSVFNFHRGLM